MRFLRRFESQIVPALKEAYPELKSAHDVEVFRRKWVCKSLLYYHAVRPSVSSAAHAIIRLDYFEYCAAGFALHQIKCASRCFPCS